MHARTHVRTHARAHARTHARMHSCTHTCTRMRCASAQALKLAAKYGVHVPHAEGVDVELLLNQAEAACGNLLQSCPRTDTPLLTTKHLRSWLLVRGMTPSELSESAGISQSELSLYLHNKLRRDKAQHISDTVLAFMETCDPQTASTVANPAEHSSSSSEQVDSVIPEAGESTIDEKVSGGVAVSLDVPDTNKDEQGSVGVEQCQRTSLCNKIPAH